MADLNETIFVDKKKFAFAVLAFFGAIVARALGWLDAGTLKEVLTAVIWAYLLAQAAHDGVKEFKNADSSHT